MITLIIKRNGAVEPFNKEKLNIILNSVLVACNPKKYLEDVSLVYTISGKIKKEFGSRDIVQSCEIQEAIERLLIKYEPMALKYYVCYNNNRANSYVPVNCVDEIPLSNFINIQPSYTVTEILHTNINSKKFNDWVSKCTHNINMNNFSYPIQINERYDLFKYIYSGYISLDRIRYNKFTVNVFQLFEESGRFNKELYINVLKTLARFIVRKVRLDKTLDVWDNKSKVYLYIDRYDEFCTLLEMTDEEKINWHKQCDDIFATELFSYANKLKLNNLEYIIKEK
jgi:hypothetical protein